MELAFCSSFSRFVPGWPRIVCPIVHSLIVQPMSSPPSAARTPTPGTSDGFGSFRGVPRPESALCCCAFCLTIAVLGVLQPVVHNGFLNYDDDQYITNNAHVRAGLTGATVNGLSPLMTRRTGIP